MIKPGDEVIVRDAHGQYHHAVADSEIEGEYASDEAGRMRKIHDFPVIWVTFPNGDRMPWPVEDVFERGEEASR